MFSWHCRLCKLYSEKHSVYKLKYFFFLNFKYPPFILVTNLILTQFECYVQWLNWEFTTPETSYFHLKFYSQYCTVLASLTTWTWKPTALTTRPTTTKHLRASLNTKYAHATCGMAKQVRLWGEGTFLGINQVQHFTWGPDNTVIYTMCEGSEQKYVAPDITSLTLNSWNIWWHNCQWLWQR